jgi:FixJ family two-component response regulator
MSNRRKNVMDIRELINQLRQGASDRQISQDMHIARQTVKRYRKWAQASGVLEGALPKVETLQAMLEQVSPAKHFCGRAVPRVGQADGGR